MQRSAAITVSVAVGSHIREHHSVLAAVEKRALVWMAERLPASIHSDHLTVLGTLAMVGAGAAFASVPATRWALALVPVCLAINWFGDSLDGTVARVRRTERPRYGFYVDHVADIANATLLFAGMPVSGIVSPWIAAGLLIAYLLLCAESFLATHALGVFRVSFSGFGPTELHILLGIGALRAIHTPVVGVMGQGDYQLFDVGGLIAIVGMMIAFVISSARNIRALDRTEPLLRR